MDSTSALTHESVKPNTMTKEEAHEKAERLLAPLRGVLHEVIQSHGGVEGYMRWVRGEDEDI